MTSAKTCSSDGHPARNLYRSVIREFVLSVFVMAAPVIRAQRPPLAPVHEVIDHYVGQTVTDPYRWMEKGESDPEVVKYIKAQNDYTRSVLATLPGREKLLARIEVLDQSGTRITSAQEWGGRFFYLK